jgi:sigma-54 dependent transcriptional regulator
MQMAEKYKLPRISLTEDAKALMLKYKWPGNVRQLKNITEQISILSREREIDATHLQKFIPQDPESTQLAPVSSTGSHSYESERELLYKILYELRGNVSDLRREVSGLRKRLDDSVAVSTELPGYSSSIASLNTKNYDTPPTLASIQPVQHAPLSNGFVEAEEINEADNESLNLNDLGRQMVEKALERNAGNRKKAAIELGISDRTLYRRIKQYGLESSK